MKNQKGVTLMQIIFIIIILIVAIFFINSGTDTPDINGKSTSDYNYLLNNKPSPEQIASAKTIDYRSLYKGANTLNGNFYSITGEVVQEAGEHIYHINMTKNGTYSEYYTDRIQISIIGETSEILMEGDIISFVGESLGNYTYTTVLGSEMTVPFLRVYAENLKVTGYTN